MCSPESSGALAKPLYEARWSSRFIRTFFETLRREAGRVHATSAQLAEVQNWHSYAIEITRTIFYKFSAG